MTNSDRPFSTIESAHEYLSILSEQFDEVLNEVRQEISTSTARQQERRVEAWQLTLYTLTKLSFHVATSRRLVNDLRTLRNLLERTRDAEIEPTSDVPEAGVPERGPEGDAVSADA
jgi:cobalamin biosynthesis Mg chelatase CobN